MLFGEGYGERIQKAGKLYNPDKISFCLFDVYIEKWILTRDSVDRVAKSLSIESLRLSKR